MAYNNTYVALDKITVGTATPSVTLSGINQTYTDLIIIVSGTASAQAYAKLTFNGVTTATYSWQNLYGTGSAIGASRTGSYNYIQCYYNYANTNPTTLEMHIFNYANTNMYKTVLLPDFDAAQEVTAKVGTWQSTAAITSVTLERVTGNWNAGTTVSLYGISASGSNPSAKATGGTITYGLDGYTYHTFTSSGTFTPSVPLTCDYLVVAGGGSGGGYLGGGGGAGGYRTTVGASGGNSSPESQLSLSATGYTVTIGAGGAPGGNSNNPGNQGSNSVFASITSTGGGFGGGDSFSSGAGGSGGSGGGSRNGGTAGSATSGQGSNGAGSSSVTTGSGGGAGSAGTASTNLNGTIGGTGLYSLLSNSFLAGGGAGGTWINGTGAPGGIGGGGASNGGNNSGTAGTVNTGGGGGGGGYQSTAAAVGGAGGSGIVIVRYAS